MVQKLRNTIPVPSMSLPPCSLRAAQDLKGLPQEILILSGREAAERTSVAFSGVPFGVSSSCLGEEEAGEEGSLLSRSL